MTAVFVIVCLVLFAACLKHANDIDEGRAPARFIVALVLIMVGDAAAVLTVLAIPQEWAVLAACSLLVSGVAAWLLIERRTPARESSR